MQTLINVILGSLSVVCLVGISLLYRQLRKELQSKAAEIKLLQDKTKDLIADSD